MYNLIGLPKRVCLLKQLKEKLTCRNRPLNSFLWSGDIAWEKSDNFPHVTIHSTTMRRLFVNYKQCLEFCCIIKPYEIKGRLVIIWRIEPVTIIILKVSL